MRADQQRLTPNERANLVAYLDGELGEAEARQLVTKLTQSATARREVEKLEQTWELLEYLPRPDAPPDLASRTLGLARQEDRRGSRFDSAAGRSARLAARAALALVVVVAAGGLGYLATARLWPDPSARLARDLTLAERLPEYRDVGSLEFLRKLDALFVEPVPEP
jgi:hypothetical protein